MPRPGRILCPQLADREWLRVRLDGGSSMAAIAAEVGCGETTVKRALARLALEGSHQRGPRRHGEPIPQRRFVSLGERLDLPGQEFDLDADVAADELARRLAEGLTDLAELVRLAGELPRDRLWGLVVDQVDASTARAAVFSASVLAGPRPKRSPRPPKAVSWPLNGEERRRTLEGP